MFDHPLSGIISHNFYFKAFLILGTNTSESVKLLQRITFGMHYKVIFIYIADIVNLLLLLSKVKIPYYIFWENFSNLHYLPVIKTSK